MLNLRKEPIEWYLQALNLMYWRTTMAKACKFCVRLNSYVCSEPDDCLDCGLCNGATNG